MLKIQRAVFAMAVMAGVVAIETGALAAGFEKVTTWSGRYTGVAGAAVAAVEGAEALYFNPAGLAGANASEVSLNFSPTFGKFEGPIVPGVGPIDGKRAFSPVFGALASYRLGPALGVGIGAFVSGGTKAIFENVDFSSLGASFESLKPNFKSDLNVIEFSIGAGMEPMPGLRVGGAWRAVRIGAELATAQFRPGAPSTLTSIELKDIAKTKFDGVRVGAQYIGSDKSWGLGANWRSSVDFTAEGDLTSKTEVGAPVPAAPVDNTGGKASVSSTFPQQFALGGYYDVLKDVRFLGEYVWTEYHKNQALTFDGTFVSGLGAGTQSIPAIQLGWQNQVNVKGGVECTALEGWAFRAGYAYTSQVTPKATARATFSSPGSASTITLGAGTKLMEMVDVNVAGEYSFASGTVTNEGATPGEYSTNVFVLHTGLTYRL